MATQVRLLMCVCLGVVVVAAAAGEGPPIAPLELRPLRDDCVRIGVCVETPALTLEQLSALYSNDDFRLPSMFYFGDISGVAVEQTTAADGANGSFFMCFWLTEQAEAILFLSKVSTDPPEQWAGSVSVNWRDMDRLIQDVRAPIAERLKAEQRARRMALERPDRLGWIVKPEKEATLGDAFQTLADLLEVEVTATWKLTESYAPTWERLLALPLEATDVQCEQGMTLQALVDCVAERLGGDAIMDDAENELVFDDLVAKAIEWQKRFDWLRERFKKGEEEGEASETTAHDEKDTGEEEAEVVTDEGDAEGE